MNASTLKDLQPSVLYANQSPAHGRRGTVYASTIHPAYEVGQAVAHENPHREPHGYNSVGGQAMEVAEFVRTPRGRWLKLIDPLPDGPVERAERETHSLLDDTRTFLAHSIKDTGELLGRQLRYNRDQAELVAAFKSRAARVVEQVKALGPLAREFSGLSMVELDAIGQLVGDSSLRAVDFLRTTINTLQTQVAVRREIRKAPLYPTQSPEDEQWRGADPADVFSRLLSTRITEGVDPIRDPQHLKLMLQAEMGRARAPDERKERLVSVRPRGFSPEQEAQMDEYLRQFGVIDRLEGQIAAQTRRMFPPDFKFHSRHKGYDDYYKYLQTRYGTARLSVPDEEIFRQLFPSVARGQEPSGSQLQALYTARRCLEAARDRELARMRAKAGMGEMIGHVAIRQIGDRAYEAQDYAFLQAQKPKSDGARPALAESSIEEYEVEVPVDPDDPSRGTVMKTESIVVKSGKPEFEFHPLRQASQAIGVRLKMAQIRMRERAQIREELLGPNERKSGWIIRTVQGLGLTAVLAGLYVTEADKTNVEHLNDLFYLARK